MDSGKDIQKVDYLAKILDGYTVRTNPFGNNVSGERAYRRAERLVSAIHILTNHISEEEPARVASRRVSITLLSDVLALRDDMRAPLSFALHTAQSSIRELISLVRVLAVSGSISSQNANVVTEALDELGSFLIASQRSTLSESTPFSKEELIGAPDLPRVSISSHTESSDYRTNKASNSYIKDTPSVTDMNRTKSSKENISENLDVRTQAILGTLKSLGIMGIKDIASNFPEYSEKMIQRELADLVALGRVKRTGLKRWSRYEFVR